MRAEFDENLVTGNEIYRDSQHKELIEKINKLLDSCEVGNDKVVAIKTLDYLADYTEFHFGEEEKLKNPSITLQLQNIRKSMTNFVRL